MEFRHWLFAAICAVILVAGSAIPACAENVLVVGVDERDWVGHYEWATGELTGIDADLVREVAESIGYTVRYRPLPWPRALLMAEERAIDGVLDLAPTAARRSFLHYVETPVSSESTVLWVKAGSPFEYKGFFDTSMHIGLMSGSDWSDRFAREGTPSVERFNNFKSVFKSLVNDRIDAFGGYLGATWAEVEKHGFVGQVEPAGMIGSELPYYLAFSVKPGHGMLARTFSDGLKAYYASEAYQALLDRHGITGKRRQYYPPPMVPPFED